MRGAGTERIRADESPLDADREIRSGNHAPLFVGNGFRKKRDGFFRDVLVDVLFYQNVAVDARFRRARRVELFPKLFFGNAQQRGDLRKLFAIRGGDEFLVSPQRKDFLVLRENVPARVRDFSAARGINFADAAVFFRGAAVTVRRADLNPPQPTDDCAEAAGDRSRDEAETPARCDQIFHPFPPRGKTRIRFSFSAEAPFRSARSRALSERAARRVCRSRAARSSCPRGGCFRWEFP